jgi:hypothetical protein
MLPGSGFLPHGAEPGARPAGLAAVKVAAPGTSHGPSTETRWHLQLSDPAASTTGHGASKHDRTLSTSEAGRVRSGHKRGTGGASFWATRDSLQDRCLARRKANKVRGPKVAWAPASFVQLVGLIAYFAAGRR